jgi:hypothetical protein
MNRIGECGEQWQRASHEAIIRLVADETLAASETNKLNARMPTLHKQNWRINNVPDYLSVGSLLVEEEEEVQMQVQLAVGA